MDSPNHKDKQRHLACSPVIHGCFKLWHSKTTASIDKKKSNTGRLISVPTSTVDFFQQSGTIDRTNILSRIALRTMPWWSPFEWQCCSEHDDLQRVSSKQRITFAATFSIFFFDVFYNSLCICTTALASSSSPIWGFSWGTSFFRTFDEREDEQDKEEEEQEDRTLLFGRRTRIGDKTAVSQRQTTTTWRTWQTISLPGPNRARTSIRRLASRPWSWRDKRSFHSKVVSLLTMTRQLLKKIFNVS